MTLIGLRSVANHFDFTLRFWLAWNRGEVTLIFRYVLEDSVFCKLRRFPSRVTKLRRKVIRFFYVRFDSVGTHSCTLDVASGDAWVLQAATWNYHWVCETSIPKPFQILNGDKFSTLDLSEPCPISQNEILTKFARPQYPNLFQFSTLTDSQRLSFQNFVRPSEFSTSDLSKTAIQSFQQLCLRV